MGVYIIDMKMPKSCWNCCVERDADCVVYKGVASASYYKKNRHPDCPLIEIPKHGRLIDADALEKSLSEELLLNDKKHLESTWNDAVAIVFDAPTIIPAEEGET